MKKKWYVATLIIRCRVENEPAPWTCDEQIRVIRASDSDEAYKKALRLGKDEEHAYRNVYEQNVCWEFVGLIELDELKSPIRDGTEIRSTLFGHQDPAKLVNSRDRLRIFQSRSHSHSSEYLYSDENTPAADD